MSDDKRAIRELVKTWIAASQAGDLQTVLGLMTDDVIFMVPGREPFGKQEFAAASQGMKNVRMEGTSDIRELKILGDWAYRRNYLTLTVTPAQRFAGAARGFHAHDPAKLPDGRWLLARDANLMTIQS
jgi:uncharacterized protein (TIGR02246 family)